MSCRFFECAARFGRWSYPAAVLFLFAVAAGPARGQAVADYWNNPAGGNYETGSNWSLGRLVNIRFLTWGLLGM